MNRSITTSFMRLLNRRRAKREAFLKTSSTLQLFNMISKVSARKARNIFFMNLALLSSICTLQTLSIKLNRTSFVRELSENKGVLGVVVGNLFLGAVAGPVSFLCGLSCIAVYTTLETEEMLKGRNGILHDYLSKKR
jgi:RsiW-degrading membrane proteinase PrsW (M82 family)